MPRIDQSKKIKVSESTEAFAVILVTLNESIMDLVDAVKELTDAVIIKELRLPNE